MTEPELDSPEAELLHRATMEMMMAECCTIRQQREAHHAIARRLMAEVEKMRDEESDI